jgi:hypothetical protein
MGDGNQLKLAKNLIVLNRERKPDEALNNKTFYGCNYL